MLCTACKLWALDDMDGFCGFCGRPIISCDIDIDEVVLVTGQQMQKSFTITNRGKAEVVVNLSADIGNGLRMLFSPLSLQVNAGRSGDFMISLDPASAQLPNFRIAGNIVCRLKGSISHTLKIPLTVMAGPKAQISPDAVDFKEVHAGNQRQVRINIRNMGGVPLGISSILCEGLQKEYFKVHHQDEAWLSTTEMSVGPGVTLPLTLTLDLHAQSVVPQNFDGALLIHFTNNNPLEMRVPVRARVFSCSCGIDPKELKIDPCPQGGEASLCFSLVNNGSSDLKVKSVETDQPWFSVPGGEHGFDLLAVASGDPARAPANGQFLCSRAFDLTVDASSLPAGVQTCSIIVRAENVTEPFRFPVTANVVVPQEYSGYIGIDFGTTNSVIAINDPQLGLILIKVADRLGKATEFIPSVLVFKGSLESSVFGYEAENAAVFYPENTVHSIKRIMGCDRSRMYFGQPLSPSVLAGMILKKLVSLAERVFYQETGQYYRFRRAIVTVPANFYGVQIQDMLKACQYAGLDIGTNGSIQNSAQTEDPVAGIILKEPTAGAIYCMRQLSTESEFRSRLTDDKPMHLLVFDYGGGTVDISLVRVQRSGGDNLELTCIATRGDNTIGGEGMTLCLMEELLNRCADANPQFDKSLIMTRRSDLEQRRREEGWGAMVWSGILAARGVWKDLAEEAKLTLTNEDRTLVRVPGEAIIGLSDRAMSKSETDYTYSLDREEFERLIDGFLEKSRHLVMDVIAKAKLKAGPDVPEPVVDYVLHTGRASRMPAVRDAVRRALPKLSDEQIILRPDLLKSSVAQGAALYGSIRYGLGTNLRINRGDSTLPFSYGNKHHSLFDNMFEPIIPMDSPCCVQKEKRFGPKDCNDGRLELFFYRNSGTNMVLDGNPEAQLIGNAVKTQTAEGQNFVVCMSVDAYGILTVEVDGETIQLVEPREKDDSWDA